MRIFVKSFTVESVNDAGIKAAKNMFKIPSKTRSFEREKIAVSKLLNVF